MRQQQQILPLLYLTTKREPIYALFDLKRRGKPEGIVYDLQRAGKWNISYWDEIYSMVPLRCRDFILMEN